MKKREVNVDLLRSLCIFAIIFIHTTVNFMVNNYPSFESKIIFVMSIFTSCAVPVFFMLSGVFLINKKNMNIIKTLKRAIHIYLQLIIWTLIYLMIFKFIMHENINILNSMLKALTYSQVPHLWFMYTLIGLYILLPFISRLYFKLNDKEKLYFILLILIIPAVINTINIKLNLFSIPKFCLFFPELGLFVLGKYLYDIKGLESKKVFIISLILIVVGAFLVKKTADFYILNMGMQGVKPYFDYNIIPNLLMVLGIFLAMINCRKVCQKIPHSISKVINYIGANTLGIYFIHMIYIYLLPSIKIGKIYITSNCGSILNMFLGWIFYFIASILSVLIIQRIPVLKKLIK